MPAIKLRKCLNTLGSNGTARIEFIEIYYGNTDYLDQVCRIINEELLFDFERTENQLDTCLSNHTAYMYPSKCNQTWLGDDCFNNCTYDNYEGFYCKRSTTTTPSSTVNSESTTRIATKSTPTTSTSITTATTSAATTTTHDVNYEALKNTYCDIYGVRFHDLQFAEFYCGNEPRCGGIFDDQCDEDGDSYFLCENGTMHDISDDFCVYRKIVI